MKIPLTSFVAALLIFGAQHSNAGNEFPEPPEKSVLVPIWPAASKNLLCCASRAAVPQALHLSSIALAKEEAWPLQISLLDPQAAKAPDEITGKPAAENALPGTGLAGRLLQLPDSSGLRLGGLWLADTNGLLSGGKQPGRWSWNSALIIGANLDAEKLLAWKGASFGVH